MHEFVNPFSGKVPERKLTKEELIRAIRLDVAAELEAIHLYMAHAEAIDDPLARRVLIDVANEEIVHVGEFQRLIQILTAGEEGRWLAQGAAEVDEMAEGLGIAGDTRNSNAAVEQSTAEPVENVTVGSLKG